MSKKARLRHQSRPPVEPHRPSDSLGKIVFICCGLLVATAAVYCRTVGFDFVNYDDDNYVYRNPAVFSGFTVHSVAWAFTHVHAANWHPLTWLSHMLDCGWWGRAPAGHHATNVFLHSCNGVLLFLVLRSMSAASWRSAMAAALFALHPLRVESVAWVAERKDVLSGLFFFLTIAAYLRYWRRPSALSYGLVALVMALGLMAKPSLVPTPFILLLLDYWPLQRFTSNNSEHRTKTWKDSWKRLVLEKLPLLAISAASAVATVLAQKFSITVGGGLPLWARVGNALVSYAVYLGQLFWPVKLAVLYPHPGIDIPLWQVAFAFLLVAGTTIAAIALAKRFRYLLTGWCWYLVMLLPTIGLVQVGFQSHADRYTYLAHIGLCIALVWGGYDLLYRFAGAKTLAATAVIVLGVFASLTARQCSYWRDSETLWRHTLNVTSGNAVAHNNLGNFYLDRNQFEQARQQYEASLRITRPVAEQTTQLGLMERAYADAENNLGLVLVKLGREQEGVECYQQVLTRFPNNPKAHLNIGNVLLDQSHVDAAIDHYRQALLVFPEYADAHFNLGNALAQKEQIDQAIDEYQKALQLQPDLLEARNNLGIAYLRKGSVAKALGEWSNAIRMSSDSVDILNNVAWILATYPDASLRNGTEALNFAERAASLSGRRNPEILRTMAAAYAETGRFDEASQVAEQAVTIARTQNNFSLLDVLRADLDHYRGREAVRTPPVPGEDRGR